MAAGSDHLTGLLQAWSRGDEAALHELIPRVERELNRIARRCLAGERHTRSVSATALVNEAFLRLVDVRHMAWQDRAHFFAMSARLMRRVLVDMARARQAEKRGGEFFAIAIDEAADLAATERAPVLPRTHASSSSMRGTGRGATCCTVPPRRGWSGATVSPTR